MIMPYFDDVLVDDLEDELRRLREQYSELAKALGFKVVGWLGEPTVSHDDILARTELCHALAMDAGIVAVQ